MLHSRPLPAPNLERRMAFGTRPSTSDSRWHIAASTSPLANVSGFSRLHVVGGVWQGWEGVWEGSQARVSMASGMAMRRL